MKKYLLLVVLLFTGCVPLAIALPATVVGKYQTATGDCYLQLRPVKFANTSSQDYQTYYDKSYCDYQIGQEIK